MDIETHFSLLLKEYDLDSLYKKFIVASVLNTTVREGFYWLLLFFSDQLKNKPENMNMYSYMLIITLGLTVPFERIFNNLKAELLERLKLANSNFFNNRIIKIDKKELLNFDLVEYYNILSSFNDKLKYYILNKISALFIKHLT